MFTDRDTRATYDEESAVRIELNGSSISASSDSVQINGTTAILTEEATYIVSGTLDDGMLVVDADEAAKLQIVLDNASITSSTSAALYVLEADKVFVTLAEGSQNALANGGSFVAIDDSDIDGAVYSKQDLTFNGSGALTVASPAGTASSAATTWSSPAERMPSPPPPTASTPTTACASRARPA